MCRFNEGIYRSVTGPRTDTSPKGAVSTKGSDFGFAECTREAHFRGFVDSVVAPVSAAPIVWLWPLWSASDGLMKRGSYGLHHPQQRHCVCSVCDLKLCTIVAGSRSFSATSSKWRQSWPLLLQGAPSPPSPNWPPPAPWLEGARRPRLPCAPLPPHLW